MYKFIFVILLVFFGCENKTQTKIDTLQDKAHIIQFDTKTKQDFINFTTNLLNEFDIDFRVVSSLSDKDINTEANEIFNSLKSMSKSGKTLLFLINAKQDKARLEVPLGLEHIYTDAFVSFVQREGIVPYFRDEKLSEGVFEMASLIYDRAYEAKAGKEFVAKADNISAGGGAKVSADIGRQEKNLHVGANIKTSSTDTPLEVVKKYLNSLKTHNKNPNLDIFTQNTKEFMKTLTSTDINQDNEVKFLTPCMNKKNTLYSYDNKYAVVANDFIKEPTCTPYFLKKEDGLWKLDIATMAKVIRFNAQMKWHFDLENRLKDEGKFYAFAFDDYVIYFKNGYVFESKQKQPKQMKWGYECGEYYLPKDAELFKKEPKKYTKCYIKRVWQGGRAMTRLGLQGGESILSIGEGENKKENVSFGDFMAYMKNAKKGDIITLEVQPYKSERRVILQGIAP